HRSISKAPVWQKLEQSGASFQLSIHEKDVRPSAALAQCAELPCWTFPFKPNERARCPDFTRSRASDYRLPNRPLTAFQSVRAAFGGPARATSTGTLARFKMLRVKSPMM